jgi:rRNA-processing protein FCF1
VGQLELLAERSGDEITVVFERAPVALASSESIEIAHAPSAYPNSADDEIVRRLEADDDAASVVVVTSDRELTARAEATGAVVSGAGGFRDQLDNAAEPGG